MGYPSKVQLIRRQRGQHQYYVNLPTVISRAMDIQAGEILEWVVSREGHLVLTRPNSDERLSLSSFPETGKEG
jgi:bifunctional DNA-binding transcriptional regulator/antitoxin component of YhaV-PrlF toxin-antitoxin module